MAGLGYVRRIGRDFGADRAGAAKTEASAAVAAADHALTKVTRNKGPRRVAAAALPSMIRAPT
jgi:hypothetical protein